jgi:hypothetical protein
MGMAIFMGKLKNVNGNVNGNIKGHNSGHNSGHIHIACTDFLG